MFHPCSALLHSLWMAGTFRSDASSSSLSSSFILQILQNPGWTFSGSGRKTRRCPLSHGLSPHCGSGNFESEHRHRPLSLTLYRSPFDAWRKRELFTGLKWNEWMSKDLLCVSALPKHGGDSETQTEACLETSAEKKIEWKTHKKKDIEQKIKWTKKKEAFTLRPVVLTLGHVASFQQHCCDGKGRTFCEALQYITAVEVGVVVLFQITSIYLHDIFNKLKDLCT